MAHNNTAQNADTIAEAAIVRNDVDALQVQMPNKVDKEIFSANINALSTKSATHEATLAELRQQVSNLTAALAVSNEAVAEFRQLHTDEIAELRELIVERRQRANDAADTAEAASRSSLAVGITVTLVVLLLAGGGVALWQRRRKQQEGAILVALAGQERHRSTTRPRLNNPYGAASTVGNGVRTAGPTATAAVVVHTPNPMYAPAGSAASFPRGGVAAARTPNPMHQSADGGNGGSSGGVANNGGTAATAVNNTLTTATTPGVGAASTGGLPSHAAYEGYDAVPPAAAVSPLGADNSAIVYAVPAEGEPGNDDGDAAPGDSAYYEPAVNTTAAIVATTTPIFSVASSTSTAGTIIYATAVETHDDGARAVQGGCDHGGPGAGGGRDRVGGGGGGGVGRSTIVYAVPMEGIASVDAVNDDAGGTC